MHSPRTELEQSQYTPRLPFLLIVFLLVSITSLAQGRPFKRHFIQRIANQASTINRYIQQQHQSLMQLQASSIFPSKLAPNDIRWIQTIAKRYRVKHFNLKKQADWKKLLLKVNIIPPSMVIAQAINESHWGQSRFAQKGRNYFGIWCYTPGCGIVPKQRPAGRTYEVKAYPSIEASVRDYFLLINRSSAYRPFRQARALLIKQKQAITGLKLISHLRHYSQKGAQYTKSIRAIINRYNLTQFDQG